MLPASLLAELYEKQITNEEFERLLKIPDDSNFTYDPYLPYKNLAHVQSTEKKSLPCLSPSMSPPLQNTKPPHTSTLLVRRKTLSPVQIDTVSTSSSLSASPTESISFWEILNVQSTTTPRIESMSSSLSLTSLEGLFRYNSLIPRKCNLSRQLSNEIKTSYCSFCYHNGECASIYTDHNLRDADKNITCPFLLEVVCRYCGATGPEAHTPKYCPNKSRFGIQRTYFSNNC